MTELLTWEPSAEPKTYEPAWLDRKVSPVFVQGRTCSINWTKDTVKNGALEAWVMEHRNETDVVCEVCRVFTWLGNGRGRRPPTWPPSCSTPPIPATPTAASRW